MGFDASCCFSVAFKEVANTINMFFGGAGPTATANDSALHSIQFVINGASSLFYVDGTNTNASSSPGTGGTNGTSVEIGAEGSNYHVLTGEINELGLWNAAFSGSDNSSVCHNQAAYWGISGC
jgi:hypothetical protein